MFSRFFRIATAATLMFSLWTSALVAAPAQQAQDQKQDQQDQQQSQQKQDQKAAPQTPAPAKTNSKPLSTKEDPNKIGTRNINTGIIAKMSGSPEKDVALGRQLAAEVDRQAKFIEDPVITEYINRVGQNIVLHSDAKVPFTIKVIDSDEVNAFALPGGFFYVNKGLILAADNEAEVAGVMAHEIAHVAARHAVENMTKGNLMQIGAIVGSIFLGGVPGLIFQNTAGLGLLAAFLKFSRAAEEEADRLGVQYLYAAGYDPNAMSAMFEKLQAKNKKKPGVISKAFSTHPQTSDRMEATRALVARFPEKEEYVVSTSEFQRVKARLMRLSNARATTAGALGSGNDGPPNRPTLKRRSPSADDTSGTDSQAPSETRPPEPPKLKRNDGSTAPATQPPSSTNP
jgi:predicted Zn-dependent protease